MHEKKLFIVDGHALVYRSYYAFIRNPLSDSSGRPTSAVFGFANYIIRLIESYSCPYLAVVLDSSKPTFRHELYQQYKANRKEMPDDLKSQIPLIRELIDVFNIPVLIQDGYEADDLIAILTKKALASDFDIFLVTRDKDLMQLVGPKVTMLAPEGTGTLEKIGVGEVIKKMGVGPDKIVDYLALIGDASDNIPGVPGVGPKTALKILETGESVEKILDNPGILQVPKLIQKIEQNRELLSLSKMLATLKEENGVEIDISDFIRKPFHKEKIIEFFSKLEFSSLINNPIFGGVPKFSATVSVVSATRELQSLIEKIKENGSLAIDTQTNSLLARKAKLAGISIALNETEAFYIPVGHKDFNGLECGYVLKELKSVLESPQIRKSGQNLKYDYQIFRNYGINLQGIDFDTMIAAYLIDSGKRNYDLDILVSQWLKKEITPLTKLTGPKNSLTFDQLPVDSAAMYAAETVCATLALKEKLEPQLSDYNCSDLFKTIEMPLVAVLGDLEWNGILIDIDLLKTLSMLYGSECEQLKNEIYEIAGEEFNLNSPKQTGNILFEKLNLPAVKKTKNGNLSTGVEVLERLAPDYEIVGKILEYRESQKLLSTYIDSLPIQVLQESKRIHASFNQTVTVTGRLSSTNPNLQNIPIRTESGKRIREAFIADQNNVLIAADYSQIELRILAHLSNDKFLIDAFLKDEDIHALTASAIYGVFPGMVTTEMRRAAKTINFGLMYGMGPINLSRQLHISFNEARMFIETYFQQFPTIKKYMENSITSARETGYTETLLGRRRYLSEINAKNRNIREAAERTAINTPVQGSAADIIKLAMIEIHKELPDICSSAKMVLQVHDELVFEVPENDSELVKEHVVEKMSNAYKLSVPLRVDASTGKNWSDAH